VERSIWQKWQGDSLNPKILYWVDQWQELIDNFNVNSYGLRLSSPHLLILAIADEIEHNALRNSETRRVFKTELSRSLKDDLVVKESLGIEFAVILKHLETDTLLHLRTLCASVAPFFTKGEYFEQCVKRLANVLQEPIWAENDSYELGRLSNVLVIELLQANYHLSTIRMLPVQLFDKVDVDPEGRTRTMFPHGIDWRDFLRNNSFDDRAYHTAITNLLESMTPLRRIETLVDMFRRPMEPGTFIFPVSGARNMPNQTLQAVTLYNPVTNPLLDSTQTRTPKDVELFSRTPDLPLVNVAVKSLFRDVAAGAQRAAEIAEETFDWIQLHAYTKHPIKIDAANYIVLDRDARPLQVTTNLENSPLVVAHGALDLNALFLSLPDGLVTSTIARISETRFDDPFASKLRICLRWYRKAVESKTPEDKLLNSWVVLERAFSSQSVQPNTLSLGATANSTKFQIIADYIPVREGLRLMYDFGWQLFYYLQVRLPYLSLSEDVQQRTGLAGKKRMVSLDHFIPNLPLLSAAVKDRIVKEKVEKARQFYNDASVAKKEICNRRDNTRDEVTLIYRLRNSIVHYGDFDRTVLPQLAARSLQLARNVTLLLFTEFLRAPSASVETIFAEAKVEYERTIARLDQNLPVNFESFKPWGTYPRTPEPTPENVP
jgi:Apea-like HEPN